MKNRAGAIASAGVPQVSVAVDAYFPRARLADCLRTLHAEFPTVLINLRITTMPDGERLVLDKTCALAITIENVPEVHPDAIERSWLFEAERVTTFSTSHAIAPVSDTINLITFELHKFKARPRRKNDVSAAEY